MSDTIESADDVLQLKKEKQILEQKASSYEFGFDTAQKKVRKSNLFINSKKRAVNKVNRLKQIAKDCKFLSTNNVESQQQTNDILSLNSEEKKQTNECDSVLKEILHKTNVCCTEKSNESLATEKNFVPRKHFVDLSFADCDGRNINAAGQTQTYEEIEFNSDGEHVIENSLVEGFRAVTESSSPKLTEPIICRLNYFKMTEKNKDSYRAMCLICGLNENNNPRTICSAKNNVSSNLVTHLKV